jgi:hypothetical protein
LIYSFLSSFKLHRASGQALSPSFLSPSSIVHGGKSQAFACYLSPAFPSSSSIVLGGKSQAFACHLSLLGYCKVLKVGNKNITNQAGFMLKNDHMKN